MCETVPLLVLGLKPFNAAVKPRWPQGAKLATDGRAERSTKHPPGAFDLTVSVGWNFNASFVCCLEMVKFNYCDLALHFTLRFTRVWKDPGTLFAEGLLQLFFYCIIIISIWNRNIASSTPIVFIGRDFLPLYREKSSIPDAFPKTRPQVARE